MLYNSRTMADSISRTSYFSNASLPSNSIALTHAGYDAELRSLVGKLHAATYANDHYEVKQLEDAIFDKLNNGQDARDLNVHFLQTSTAIEQTKKRIKEHLVESKGKWLRAVVGEADRLTSDERQVRAALLKLLSEQYYDQNFRHRIDPNHCGCLQIAWKKGKLPPPSARSRSRRHRRGSSAPPPDTARQFNTADELARKTSEQVTMSRPTVSTSRDEEDILSGSMNGSSGYDSQAAVSASNDSVSSARSSSQSRIPIIRDKPLPKPPDSNRRVLKKGSNGKPQSTKKRPSLKKRPSRSELIIRKLSIMTMAQDDKNKIRSVIVGATGAVKDIKGASGNRALLFTGATGVGKTTMINAIANYVHGVQYDDDERVTVVTREDEGSKSVALGQTEWLTAFKLLRPPNSPLDYDVTIIDTPGFGESDEKDKQAFASPILGVQLLHSIGLVIQGSQLRLTNAHRTIIDNVMCMFGKDVRCLSVLATFSDTSNVRVTSALRMADVPTHGNIFTFSNNSLYVLDDQAIDIERTWESNRLQFELLFEHIEKGKPFTLQMSHKVLTERENQEQEIAELHVQLNQYFIQCERLEKLHIELETLMEKGQKAPKTTVKIETYEFEQIPSKRGQFYMNKCESCDFVCHFPCQVGERSARTCNCYDETKICRVCPNNCAKNEHKIVRVEVKIKPVRKAVTVDELQRQYNIIGEEQSTVKHVIEQVDLDLASTQMKALSLIREIVKRQESINKIALKPGDSLPVDVYIDKLIVQEGLGHQPGFEQRIIYLQKLKQVNESHPSEETESNQ